MCRNRIISFLRNIAGAAALELALLTPFLAVTVLGLSDAGLATAQKMRLNAAAQNGAQYGLVRSPIQGDVSGIVSAIGAGEQGVNRVTTVVLKCECSSGVTVACTTTCGGFQRRKYMDITVTENYHALVPYPILGATIPLTANVLVRLQ